MPRVPIVLLLLAPALPLAAGERKVDERALAKLRGADRLAYRPLEQGLRDVSLRFTVSTSEGRLECLWLYRAPTDDAGPREKRAVTNVPDRKKARLFAHALREHFHLVSWPVLLRPFSEEAEGMNVEWSDLRGGMTVLTPPEGSESRFSRVAFVWDEEGLPREVSWEESREDPEEGPYKVELTATYEWKRVSGHHVLVMMNSDRSGSRVLARYEYARAKGILLPSVVTRIDPFSGEDRLELRELRVNEGLSDEDFARR